LSIKSVEIVNWAINSAQPFSNRTTPTGMNHDPSSLGINGNRLSL
jgi:hypothetical protein